MPVTLAWNRPSAATVVAKTPVFETVHTETATGCDIDFVIDSTDSDFTGDTLLMRLALTLSAANGRLTVNGTLYQFDGTNAYVDNTNPANSAAIASAAIAPMSSTILDTIWTNAGFDRTNPT